MKICITTIATLGLLTAVAGAETTDERIARLERRIEQYEYLFALLKSGNSPSDNIRLVNAQSRSWPVANTQPAQPDPRPNTLPLTGVIEFRSYGQAVFDIPIGQRGMLSGGRSDRPQPIRQAPPQTEAFFDPYAQPATYQNARYAR